MHAFLTAPNDPKTSRMLSHHEPRQTTAQGLSAAQCWTIAMVLTQHGPASCSPAQGWPTMTCLLQAGVAGALDCMCRTALQEAGHMPRQESSVAPSPGGHCVSPGCQTSACRVSVRAQPSPKGGIKSSPGALEELSSPLPALGPSFLEVPHEIKAHQRFPGKADSFLLSAGTFTFTQAGRVQLQLGPAAQDTASSSLFPPMDRTDMPGAHRCITDESKGTLGCVHHSTVVTVLPAIPRGGTRLQLCKPTTSPYVRW